MNSLLGLPVAQNDIRDIFIEDQRHRSAEQPDAQIRSAFASETDTFVYTDSDLSKLDGIEANATADQTASEIKAVG